MKRPFTPGAPLFPSTEANGRALQSALDSLQNQIACEIETNVRRDAGAMLARGYRLNELMIYGFGSEVCVRARKRIGRLRLFARRAYKWWNPSTATQLAPFYRLIEVDDFDTNRLIQGLDLLKPTIGGDPWQK